MNQPDCFAIQGFFTQRLEGFTTRHGLVAISIHEAQYPFSGYIVLPCLDGHDGRSPLYYPDAQFDGEIVDGFGSATIAGKFEDGRSVLKLKKLYRHRSDEIFYRFELQQEGGHYLGGFDGAATGSGLAACILVPSSRRFWNMSSVDAATARDVLQRITRSPV